MNLSVSPNKIHTLRRVLDEGQTSRKSATVIINILADWLFAAFFLVFRSGKSFVECMLSRSGVAGSRESDFFIRGFNRALYVLYHVPLNFTTILNFGGG